MVRSTVRILCLAGSLASLTALPMSAQEKSTKETKATNIVPPSAQPPAGLCRVWLENVPTSQQPAPTDCATAIKNRPQNAKLVFGNLQDEAAKPPRRFEAPPRIPGRPSETRTETRAPDGAGGVHPVGASMPVIRPPTTDSGAKRRP